MLGSHWVIEGVAMCKLSWQVVSFSNFYFQFFMVFIKVIKLYADSTEGDKTCNHFTAFIKVFLTSEGWQNDWTAELNCKNE